MCGNVSSTPKVPVILLSCWSHQALGLKPQAPCPPQVAGCLVDLYKSPCCWAPAPCFRSSPSALGSGAFFSPSVGSPRAHVACWTPPFPGLATRGLAGAGGEGSRPAYSNPSNSPVKGEKRPAFATGLTSSTLHRPWSIPGLRRGGRGRATGLLLQPGQRPLDRPSHRTQSGAWTLAT